MLVVFVTYAALSPILYKKYTFFGLKFLGLKFAFCKPMTFHKSEWQYFDLTWDICSAELTAIWLAGGHNSAPSLLYHSRCKHSLETLHWKKPFGQELLCPHNPVAEATLSLLDV